MPRFSSPTLNSFGAAFYFYGDSGMDKQYPTVPAASVNQIQAEIKDRVERFLHPDGTLNGEHLEARALRAISTQDLLALLVYTQHHCDVEPEVEVKPEVEPQPETPPKPEGRFPWSR